MATRKVAPPARKITADQLSPKEWRELQRQAENAVQYVKYMDLIYRYSKDFDRKALRRLYRLGMTRLSPARSDALVSAFGMLRVGRK